MLPGVSDLAVAIAAVYRFVAARFEGDLGFLTALGAFGREHLAGTAAATWCRAAAAAALGFSFLPASRTAFGFIGITLGMIEFLLVSREGEGCAAVSAL
jgi:hypothetical protein